MQLHIAFTVTLDDLLAAPARLEARGIQPLCFFGQPTTEPWVIGWMPAATLYFRDPEGHMLEYLTMLDEPARREAGVAARATGDRRGAVPALMKCCAPWPIRTTLREQPPRPPRPTSSSRAC
jgi:hypothetical protein